MVVKARQIGFSTVLSIETTHAACTRYNYSANLISVNQEEASSKLRVGASLHASIPEEMSKIGFKPPKYRDAEEALAFHYPPYTSEVISKPGTHALRGGAKSIYFDEAAFIEKFDRLWQAGVPAALRGDNRVTVISTPMGQSGKYYDIATNIDKYPNFSRHTIPWWESRFMVRDGALEDAIALAPTMDTDRRVIEFGSQKLIETVYKSMDIVSFQTEMECMFVDEVEAFYPWELVVGGVDDSIERGLAQISAIPDTSEISIGVDLAKKRDETVFTVTEHTNSVGDTIPSKKILYIERLANVSYDEQYYRLAEIVKKSRARRVSIDETGVGQIFVERAKREGFGTNTIIEGITFTNSKKENWATRFKSDIQRGSVRYIRDADLMRQIHGIKRKKSESGFYRFAGDHDDIFWSMMLSLYGEGHEPAKFYRLG